jgi:hypothetical protein
VDTIVELLSSIKVIGPIGVIALIEAWALYSLFNRLEDLQEKRLQDWKDMKEEYTKLSENINSTLDTVLKIIGRRNGDKNGGNCNGQ